MSVFTQVGREALSQLLSRYDIGKLLSFQGIEQGIRNTNYFVTTTASAYVLTVFEHVDRPQIDYHIRLMHFLSTHDIPSPSPVVDKAGRYIHTLSDRPCLLVKKIDGRPVQKPNTLQCQKIAEKLAKFHLKTRSFDPAPQNTHNLATIKEKAGSLRNRTLREHTLLLQDEIDFHRKTDMTPLPHGTTHTDLFRDNVLFDGNTLLGILDFYDSCHGPYLFDFAVMVNDWCRTPVGTLDDSLYQAMLGGYSTVRAFQSTEKKLWGQILRKAALYYWVSRLTGWHAPKNGYITHTKDPDAFLRILTDCRLHSAKL